MGEETVGCCHDLLAQGSNIMQNSVPSKACFSVTMVPRDWFFLSVCYHILRRRVHYQRAGVPGNSRLSPSKEPSYRGNSESIVSTHAASPRSSSLDLEIVIVMASPMVERVDLMVLQNPKHPLH